VFNLFLVITLKDHSGFRMPPAGREPRLAIAAAAASDNERCKISLLRFFIVRFEPENQR
jgi:hypothetical protein